MTPLNSRRALMTAGAIAFAAVLIAAPAFANSITLTVNGGSNPTITKGSKVTLNNFFGGIAGETDVLNWEAVLTPSGFAYVITLSPVSFSGGASGGSITCNIPYGGSGGSLAPTAATGTASQTGCSGAASWFKTTSTISFAQLSADCETTPNTPPATSGSGGNGDTTLGGTYNVIGCYSNSAVGGAFSSADQTFNTPQFGSLLLVVTAGLGVVALVKRRNSRLTLPAQ